MKTGRGVNVCNRNIELNRTNKARVGSKDSDLKRHIEFNKDDQLCPTNLIRQRYDWKREAECQCNIRSNLTGYCTPWREQIVYYSGIPTHPKQVYTYSRVRSFTDIGVGSVVAQQKKRVRKIYLPETENRGVGSTDLSPLIKVDKKHRYYRGDYPKYAKEEYVRYGREDFCFPRQTSSKCVGGAVDNIKQCTEKLSPIICYIRSNGTISNEMPENKAISKDIGNNTIKKNLANITTQVESTNERNVQASSKQIKKDSQNVKEMETLATAKSVKSPVKTNQVVDNVTSVRSPIKKFQESTIQKSSDSLEQHVHNLEDPSYIPSTGSSDPMENKLEKEYRRMFTAKNKDDKDRTEKPIQDLKSTSVLRRRFEALRRGIAKKEDYKRRETNSPNMTGSKESDPAVESSGIVQSSTNPTGVDISVESDPPSLEARSFSQTKLFSPAPSAYSRRSRNVTRKKSHVDKKAKENLNWPLADKKTHDSDVQGMFKVWGEKFNFEGGKQTSPGVLFDKSPKEVGVKIRDDMSKTDSQEKKEGKRFFFFKKKSKDKAKSPCKSKKGVTTGRCEVKNRLVINGPPQLKPDIKYASEEKLKEVVIKPDDPDDIIKKNWLQKFIQRTIESRKSLQIRWNNKTYTTSSSTVFELMDNVYRQTEVIIRSQSETSTVTSSCYQPYNRHRVNFVQDIEAWMVPKLERDVTYNIFRRNVIQSGIKDRKWFIDKSKAFAHKIELVLHSKNFVKYHRAMSSEYLRIDIPKGFFSDVSTESDRFATSNSEEVYKIIEYESPESRSEIRVKMEKEIGDYNNEKVTKKVSVRDKDTDTRVIESVIKKPPIHRDVVIQGSNVHIPKRCDVIGVGIITHRDIRELTRPKLKLDDGVSDEESQHLMENSMKQCEFAESYLREYYRNWMPLGIDTFSSCASDIYVKGETEESSSSINNQGDGTKSCPNLKDYISITNLNPASSNSCPYKDPTNKSNIITTFKSLTQSEPAQECKRIIPKDSFEVLKKRMMHGCGKKTKWYYEDEPPCSVPSFQDKEQDYKAEQSSKAEQSCNDDCTTTPKPRKKCTKRVSITSYDYGADSHSPCRSPVIEFKPLPGILSFTKRGGSIRNQATLSKDMVCDIEPAPCKEYCISVKSPQCSKPRPKQQPKHVQDSCAPLCPPRTICSCTCTPKLSSALISPSCSFQQTPPLSPRNTKIVSNNYTQVSNQRQIICDITPCACAPDKPKAKDKPKKPSPFESPQSPSPTESPRYNPVSSPPHLPPIRIPSPSPNSSPNTSKTTPPQKKTTKADKCCCIKSLVPDESPPCSRCFKRDHLQSSNTHHPHHKTSQGPEESLFSPISSKLTKISKIDSNTFCPWSPCESRLTDIAQKVKNLPKMQGLQSKMPPAPNLPKCRSDCPKFPSKDSIKKEMPPSDISCPLDETMAIRVKEQTLSIEKLQEDLNVKVQDADGKTLYERRDYRKDNTECHSQPLLADMYKVNRAATHSSEKMAFTEGTHEASKSEASIANLIEISFGLKVSQGDKMTAINLGNEQEEMDKTRGKGCKPCNAEKSQDVFMTSGETELPVDDSSEKNDINIKIIIKNFKTKAEKSKKCRKNDDFSRKISEKFQTVSTGYSDVMPHKIDNIYSIHRTTVDLTTSNSQFPLDINGGMENNEMKVNIQEPIPNAIETVGEQLENVKIQEEIKKHVSLDRTLKTEINEGMQMQSETDKNIPKTKTDDKLCTCITGEIKKFNIEDFRKPALLHTEEIKEETTEKIHNINPDYKNYKMDKEILEPNKEILNPDEEMQKHDEDIQKSDEYIQKTYEYIQKPDEDHNAMIQEIASFKIKRIISDIVDTISEMDKTIQDTKSDIDKRMHILMPVINSSKDNESSNIKNSKEDKIHSVIDDKIKAAENNKAIPSDGRKVVKIQVNEMKSISKFAPDAIEKKHFSENESAGSQINSKTEEITSNDKIIKLELDNSMLEKSTGSQNYAVLPSNKTQNEKINTSDMQRESKLIKDKSVISQKTRSNIINVVIPTNRNETEKIVVSEVVPKSELIKNKSESGDNNNDTKNKEKAMPENKSGIEKLNTSITIELKLDAHERIQSIENYEEIPETNPYFETEKNTTVDTENNTNIATVVICETVHKDENVEVKPEINTTITTDNDLLLSETVQIANFWNWQSEFDEKDKTIEKYEKNNKLDVNKTKKEKRAFDDEIANEITNFEKLLKTQKQLQYPTDFHKPVEITPDVDMCEESQIQDACDIAENSHKEPDTTEDERNFDQDNAAMSVCNQHIEYSLTHLSHTDTDEQENNIDPANTSDDVYDNSMEIWKPHSKREKKEKLKHVFEKATTQKWKTKGRMKRLRNMLKSILTSDSSEVEETVVTRKNLVQDITYSPYDPSYFRATESMTNYYRVDNVFPSDDENKMAGSYPTQEPSEVSDSSDYQTNVSKCVCNAMAERIKKPSDNFLSGCCCRSPPKVHAQTSCNMTNDQALYMVNYKAAEYIDVQTQNSIINSRVTNVMVMKKMESVMTSKKSCEDEKFKINSTVSPIREDKECEARNVKTNTVLGLIDDGKIVVRTLDENKMSMQTEIVIGWKGKDKKKQKKRENVYFTRPSDVLQCYETKKAVLEIFAEKTVSDKEEKLVAKLPKFLYEKEEEIELNYVKNFLLAQDNI